MATHAFRLAAPGSPEIVVENSMLRGVRVRANGSVVRRSRGRGRPYWPIPMAGGDEEKLYVTGTLTGLRAMTAHEEIQLERRLRWWELLLVFLPLALVTFGGLFGGALGALGMVAALRVMRQGWVPAARITAALAVFAFSIAGWLGLRELIVALFYSG